MRGKTVRVLALTLGLCLTTFLSAGCSQTGEVKTSGNKTEPKKMETIEVWTNNAHSKAQDVKMVEDFNNGPGKEKGINISYTVHGGDYTNTIQVSIASGQTPHLFKPIFSATPLNNLIDGKSVVAIDDFPGGKEIIEKYKPYLQPARNVIKGKTYCLPYELRDGAVAYNKELLKKNGFSKPPETWNELVQMARVITKNGNGKEFGFIEGLKATGYAAGMNGLFHYANTVGSGEFDNKTGKFVYTKFTPFYQHLVDMKKDGSWFPGVEGMNNDQARAQFAEGNIGFKLSGSWDCAVWEEQFPAKMDWGICRPVENLNDVRYKDYGYYNECLVIGAKAKEVPEKAFEVFKLWHSDETMIKLYEEGKNIPYNFDLVKKAKNVPKLKNWSEFADLSTVYVTMSTTKGELKLEGENDTAVISKILTLSVPVDQGLADLEKRYNAALDKAIKDGLNINDYINKDLDNRLKK